MKVLIVNSSDKQGGAARAAYRLHKSLLDIGIESQMLVQSKTSDDITVIGPKTKTQKAFGKIRPTLDMIPVLNYEKRSNSLFSPSWLPFSNIVSEINRINPDVVHLHWITGGMLRIEDILNIKAPIVWSLHDNWSFTGGCHVNWGCEKFKSDCGSCPRLGSDKDNDLSRKIYSRKQRVYSQLPNIKIVGLSNWLAKCASESSLFKNKDVICLPNPINTSIYSPFNKNEARRLLNLPTNKKLIIFGAINATSDINKGFSELSQALELIDSNNVELAVFGASHPQGTSVLKHKTHYIGHLYDDISLRLMYSAADVMVVPSLQENLSNAIMESLSCGTPVVGFDVGGNSDLIDHLENGYLANELSVEDLAKGIEWVLHEANYNEISKNSRIKITSNFDSKVIANKYFKLYKSVK